VSFLLDTNVVSESVRPQPDARVMQWLATVDEDRVYLSVITLAEIRYGIERLAKGRRRKRLDDWLRDDLLIRFEDRILPITSAVADAWGKIVAQRDAIGRPISVTDAFIAATAEVHDLTLVTRDASDFAPTVKDIVSPWLTGGE
jgi:hypothetical protein